MKKLGWFMGIWAGLLSVTIICNSHSEISYTIRYDSDTQQTYALKEAVQETYQELVSGVHGSSQILMIMQNLSRFEVEKDVQATWRNGELQIIEGDGKGTVIEGSLEAYSICLPQVQPRSLLEELFF